ITPTTPSDGRSRKRIAKSETIELFLLARWLFMKISLTNKFCISVWLTQELDNLPKFFGLGGGNIPALEPKVVFFASSEEYTFACKLFWVSLKDTQDCLAGYNVVSRWRHSTKKLHKVFLERVAALEASKLPHIVKNLHGSLSKFY